MVLNYDVLFVIMSFLPRRSDVASIMRTCRTLHSAGVKPLLDFGVHLEVHRFHQVESFHQFMFSGKSPRFPLLRSFSLYADEVSPNSVGLLIDILMNSNRLEILHLYPCEYILELDPCLSSLFSNLESIKELFIGVVDEKTFAMLEDFQSSLRKAEISLINPDDEQDKPEDILPLLVNSSSSLQELELFESEITHRTVQYPHLHTLTLWESYMENVDDLLYAFPNLRKLKIPTDLENTYSWMEPEVQEQLHQSNRESQLHCSWADQEYVKSRANIVYTLGLACKIHHLDLDSPNTTSSPPSYPTLAPPA
ncbi:hypothetical protein AcV5_009101 [Taiwanofungus camphoratus]|nr:hypothetical protein AcV5_009101 [Antrodia cinnamomea]KAI0924386.1 hypothetical protein AcW2_005275 [Antrodia cinnamomea]